MIRVPFFLLFGFNKGTLKQKGQKGTTQEPRRIPSNLKGTLVPLKYLYRSVIVTLIDPLW